MFTKIQKLKRNFEILEGLGCCTYGTKLSTVAHNRSILIFRVKVGMFVPRREGIWLGPLVLFVCARVSGTVLEKSGYRSFCSVIL
jgi:hypothetical protein